MLEYINKRLQDDDLCIRHSIPLYKTVWERFNHLRYLTFEFWDKKDILNNYYNLFGLGMGSKVYKFVRYGAG